MLHQEGDRAAPLSRAKILEHALSWHHVKRRGLFIGEGAHSPQAGSVLLQLNEIRDHILNDGGLEYGVYGILGNHACAKRRIKVGLPFGLTLSGGAKPLVGNQLEPLAMNIEDFDTSVLLQVLAQFGDVDVHTAAIEVVRVAPNGIQSELSFQQGVFGFGQ